MFITLLNWQHDYLAANLGKARDRLPSHHILLDQRPPLTASDICCSEDFPEATRRQQRLSLEQRGSAAAAVLQLRAISSIIRSINRSTGQGPRSDCGIVEVVEYSDMQIRGQTIPIHTYTYVRTYILDGIDPTTIA